jgi:hypothetical protein
MDEDWVTPFEDATTPILQQAGYAKVDILTYKARWSISYILKKAVRQKVSSQAGSE